MSPRDDASRLRRLVDLSLELGRRQGVGRVLQGVADALLELIDADRAFVVLAGEHVVASAYRDGHGGEPSLSVANHVIASGREVVTSDIQEDALVASRSVMSLGLRTVLAVPLHRGDDVIGALYADSSRRGHAELQRETWLARAYAAHASVALANARSLARARRRSLRAREAAHDIRNLANTIELGLDELTELELPGWAQQTLDDVRRMNTLAMRTATAALDEARGATQAVPLRPLVERCVSLARFEARKRAVQVRCDAADVATLGVADDLSRVVVNLLGNALKYSPAAGVVRVTLRPDADAASLTVEDEGPGLPPDQLQAIFRSGQQGAGALEGHGLGLGICREVVRQHGGTIHARNGTRGAVFEVRLPLAAASTG